MSTLFTQIIDGDVPARFVWRDEHCVAFLTIAPVVPGHVLVVPREEVDHWIDAPPALMDHLVATARTIGAAQLAEFGGERSGLVVQGYGVPHLHLHVFPTASAADFRELDGAPASAEELDEAATRLRRRLRALGHGDAGEGTQA